MTLSTEQIWKPRRPGSDIEISVRSRLREIGRVNRVGRKWIARFEAEGRDAFEADPFTSKKAALAWMQTEARSYFDVLAETLVFIRFRLGSTSKVN